MSLGRFGTVLVLGLLTAGAASVPSDRTLRPAAEAIEEGAGAAAGPGAGARLGIPRLAGGQMVWGPAAEPLAPDLAPFRNALDPAAAVDSDREAAWRSLARAPRWRLYAYGRLSDMMPAGAINSPYYVMVMAGDDASENDDNPLLDGIGPGNPGAGILAMRAEAFGPRGAHTAIELTVARIDAAELESARAGVRVLSWRAVR